MCDTHLLPLETMPHCRHVKSQCFQTFLIQVHNCKGRLYARVWKMCNTPISYSRVRASQNSSPSDLNGWIPQISSSASSGRCFFNSTAGENSFHSHKWPQFPVTTWPVLTLRRGVWKKESCNPACTQARGKLPVLGLHMCRCLHQVKRV